MKNQKRIARRGHRYRKVDNIKIQTGGQHQDIDRWTTSRDRWVDNIKRQMDGQQQEIDMWTNISI